MNSDQLRQTLSISKQLILSTIWWVYAELGVPFLGIALCQIIRRYFSSCSFHQYCTTYQVLSLFCFSCILENTEKNGTRLTNNVEQKQPRLSLCQWIFLLSKPFGPNINTEDSARHIDVERRKYYSTLGYTELDLQVFSFAEPILLIQICTRIWYTGKIKVILITTTPCYMSEIEESL